MRKAMNPLYHVGVKKNQIGKIQKVFELLLKKTGIEFVYEYFEELLVDLLKRVKSTVTFQMLVELAENYQSKFFGRLKV